MNYESISEYGPSSAVGQFWRDLRLVVGSDLPEPEVVDDKVPWLLWDTPNYEVRVQVPSKSVFDDPEGVTTWEGRHKATGCRTSGQGNPFRYSPLVIWFGRLCGEASKVDR